MDISAINLNTLLILLGAILMLAGFINKFEIANLIKISSKQSGNVRIGAIVVGMALILIGIIMPQQDPLLRSPTVKATPSSITAQLSPTIAKTLQVTPGPIYAIPSNTAAPGITPEETVQLYYQHIKKNSVEGFDAALTMLTPDFITRGESIARKETGEDFKTYHRHYWNCYSNVEAIDPFTPSSSDLTATVVTQLKLDIGHSTQIWPQTLYLVRQDKSAGAWRIDKTDTTFPPNPFNCLLYR